MRLQGLAVEARVLFQVLCYSIHDCLTAYSGRVFRSVYEANLGYADENEFK
jgi:hypothetical protein